MTDAYWPWDMELGTPHPLPENFVKFQYDDWEQNARKVIAHNVDRWLEQYIETMPYWGA